MIKKLPDHVVNQIKAGEVVERPANVVKELVENALDALSTEVVVELIDGGKKLIRVTDNGCGLMEEDLSLCLERHATSKLQTLEDLNTLSTLGFRGEALPSIAAVSRFSISSRTADTSVGLQLDVNEGIKSESKKVPMGAGTSVSVVDLFTNVPARLKFLKATGTEFSHVHDFLFGMALAYPAVSFKLIHNGKTVFFVQKAPNLNKRTQDLLGSDFSEFTSVKSTRGSFRISGFVTLPAFAKAIPKYFVTFVNGRLVKDRVIRAGILQAYSGLLVKGLIPGALLMIEVDPSWVDVNASPDKTEIRFTDAGAVADLITMAIQNAVKEKVTAQVWQEEPSHFAATSFNSSPVGAFHRSTYEAASSTISSLPTARNLTSEPVVRSPFSRSILDEEKNYQPLMKPSGPFSSAQFLGQYRNCYLLLEIASDLWIVDQHAFHERILFEEFINAHKDTIPRQSLIVPLVVSLPPGLHEVITDYSEKLSELGFQVEALRNGNLAVHTFPAFLNQEKAQEIFEEVLVRTLALAHISTSEVHPLISRIALQKESLADLNLQSASLEAKEVYHLFFATMACHSAVRSGDPLSQELVRRLLSRAGDVDFYAHCPHGRPVVRKFTEKDVSLWFQRT